MSSGKYSMDLILFSSTGRKEMAEEETGAEDEEETNATSRVRR